jgi:hypothetical protein
MQTSMLDTANHPRQISRHVVYPYRGRDNCASARRLGFTQTKEAIASLESRPNGDDK